MVRKKKEVRKANPVMTVTVQKQDVSNTNESLIASLNVLLVSSGWQIVRRVLSENILYLEKMILERVDPETKQELTDKQLDEARTKRKLNIELRDLPQNYLAVLTDQGSAPKEFDPYWKDAVEMRKSHATAPIQVN